MGFKLKVVFKKFYDYVRYDLKEIAFPSSLPDPPHIKKRRKLTWRGRFYVLKEASRLYAASWVRDIGPELRPNDCKKNVENGDKSMKQTMLKKRKSHLHWKILVVMLSICAFICKSDVLHLLKAVAARGGMETVRPALQRIYMTRASAYRDALKSFIEGYQDGVQQVMEKKDLKSQVDKETPKKPT